MIRVGLLGSGVAIRTHLPGFRQAGASVDAIFSPNVDKARALAREHAIDRVYSSYEDLCADATLDLVSVTSPNEYHAEQAACALNEGRSVLCEKPLALTSSACDRLAALARQHPAQGAWVNTQLRFSPYLMRLRDLIRSGDFGDVVSARIVQQGMSASNRNSPFSWSFDSARGGGVRWAMGSHLVDLALWLFGFDGLHDVNGGMGQAVAERVDGNALRAVNVSDDVWVTLRWSTGFHCYLHSSAAAHSGFQFTVVVYTEHAEIRFDLLNKLVVFTDRGNRVVEHRQIPGLKDGEIDNKVSFFSGTFRYFADELVRALTHETIELTDGPTFRQGRLVVSVLEGVAVSHATGQPVRINDGYAPRSLE